MILTIATRELRSLFLSPLAWAVLAVVQALLAFLFLGHVDFFLQVEGRLVSVPDAPGLTELVANPLLGNAAVVLLLVVPLLSMRLVSEERRARTLTLLFSAPVSMTEIVLGKYLGLMLFLLVILLLIALMPLSLLLGGGLDLGMFAAGLLGLLLLLGAFGAVGLFMSTITHHPTVAGIGAFGALLLFWVLDWSGQGTSSKSVLAYLSLLNHYEPFLRGVFDSADALYYLLFILAFLALSVRRLDAERLGA
jgi:ABC-2 type transport system permease protein